MTKKLLPFSLACIALVLFTTGCHTSKRSVAHNSHKPTFMDDIYMDRHNKNSMTINGISSNTNTGGSASAEDNTPLVPIKPSKPLNNSEINSLKSKYSDMIGVKSNNITNYSLYRFIDEWYGVNYRSGGTEKSGIDCSGFARRLYTDVFGIDLERTACDQYNKCQHIKNVAKAQEGDLVFFHIHGRRISHVGVYLQNDYFVHASTSGGVMISNLNDAYWHKYFAGAGKVVRE